MSENTKIQDDGHLYSNDGLFGNHQDVFSGGQQAGTEQSDVDGQAAPEPDQWVFHAGGEGDHVPQVASNRDLDPDAEKWLTKWSTRIVGGIAVTLAIGGIGDALTGFKGSQSIHDKFTAPEMPVAEAPVNNEDSGFTPLTTEPSEGAAYDRDASSSDDAPAISSTGETETATTETTEDEEEAAAETTKPTEAATEPAVVDDDFSNPAGEANQPQTGGTEGQAEEPDEPAATQAPAEQGNFEQIEEPQR